MRGKELEGIDFDSLEEVLESVVWTVQIAISLQTDDFCAECIVSISAPAAFCEMRSGYTVSQTQSVCAFSYVCVLYACQRTDTSSRTIQNKQ